MRPRGGRGEPIRQHSHAQRVGGAPSVTLTDPQRAGRVQGSFSLPLVEGGRGGLEQRRGGGGGADEGERTGVENLNTEETGGTYNTTDHFLGTNTHSKYTRQYECELRVPLARQRRLTTARDGDGTGGTAADDASDLRSTMEHFRCALPFLPSLPTPSSSGGETNPPSLEVNTPLRNLFSPK